MRTKKHKNIDKLIDKLYLESIKSHEVIELSDVKKRKIKVIIAVLFRGGLNG